MPLVSILMPYHNASLFLRASIASLIGQTLADFEAILVDDASADGSRVVAEEAVGNDPRFIFIENDENRGLAASLNKALERASGVYVARMDADDIALPHRLERQARFLESHPDVGLVGAWEETFGEGRKLWRFPCDDPEIKSLLFFKTAMSHPLFFFRRDAWLEAGLKYDESFRVAQDYELLTRAAMKMKMANIPEVLLKYRQHGGQASELKKKELMLNVQHIASNYARMVFPDYTEKDMDFLKSFTALRSCGSIDEFRAIVVWAVAFYEAITKKFGQSRFVSSVASRKYFLFCRQNAHLGWVAIKEFMYSPFSRYAPYSVFGLGKFIAYSLLRKAPTR